MVSSLLTSFCSSILPFLSQGPGRQKETFFLWRCFPHLLQLNIQVRKQMESSPGVLANRDRQSCLSVLFTWVINGANETATPCSHLLLQLRGWAPWGGMA